MTTELDQAIHRALAELADAAPPPLPLAATATASPRRPRRATLPLLIAGAAAVLLTAVIWIGSGTRTSPPSSSPTLLSTATATSESSSQAPESGGLTALAPVDLPDGLVVWDASYLVYTSRADSTTQLFGQMSADGSYLERGVLITVRPALDQVGAAGERVTVRGQPGAVRDVLTTPDTPRSLHWGEGSTVFEARFSTELADDEVIRFLDRLQLRPAPTDGFMESPDGEWRLLSEQLTHAGEVGYLARYLIGPDDGPPKILDNGRIDALTISITFGPSLGVLPLNVPTMKAIGLRAEDGTYDLGALGRNEAIGANGTMLVADDGNVIFTDAVGEQASQIVSRLRPATVEQLSDLERRASARLRTLPETGRTPVGEYEVITRQGNEPSAAVVCVTDHVEEQCSYRGRLGSTGQIYSSVTLGQRWLEVAADSLQVSPWPSDGAAPAPALIAETNGLRVWDLTGHTAVCVSTRPGCPGSVYIRPPGPPGEFG